MRLHPRLRQPARTAQLIAVAALATGLALIGPSAAPASTGYRGGAAARHHTAQKRCARSARNRSTKPARGSRAHSRPCVSGSLIKRRAPGASGGQLGALEATPLYSAGAPALASGGGAAAAAGEASRRGRPGGARGAPEAKPAPLPVETGEVLTDPIDPRFLTGMPFGTRSFWLQPWRAYEDTWPASRLLESVGVNFNVSGPKAEPIAQLLQDSGFKLARIEVPWAAISYEDPTSFQPGHLANIAGRLSALHDHGLRPLIVLDANSEAPTPEKRPILETIADAPAGAQTVQLSAASAAKAVPGKTGFNYLSFGGGPDILITAVNPQGIATLSRPLANPLLAGRHGGTTLRYAPFARPTLANGEPNPLFQETLGGWLSYVAAVCKEAASVVGPDGFDLEIWNELSFGSQFLNAENYYSNTTPPPESQAQSSHSSAAPASTHEATSPESGAGAASSASSAGQDAEAPAGAEAETETEGPASSEGDYGTESDANEEVEEGPEEGPEEGAGASSGESAARSSAVRSIKAKVNKEIRKMILDATVGYVHDPANRISQGVGVTNGFASETPFPSGASAPPGLTALSKHPYVGAKSFPAKYREGRVFPLNALGTRDTLPGSLKPLFVPSYQSLLPEYMLTGVSTETLTRDLAPFTNYIYHFPHGRNVGPPGGSPVQKWITEYNLSPAKGTVEGPDGVTPQTGPSAMLSPADKTHFRAKALLRSLVANVNKGISREYFFAAAPSFLGMISEAFLSAAEAEPGTYPGDAVGGETMTAFRDMLARFQGPGPSGTPQQLKLVSIAQDGNHAQFAGDGTAAHPPLYDRDVLAVLPFQSSPTRFVIPVYVMTRDLLTLYEPGAAATDITRFDLPDETFRITLSNLPETGTPPTVSAYDPLRNQSTPARIVSREGDQAVVEFTATDYPRLLTIND